MNDHVTRRDAPRTWKRGPANPAGDATRSVATHLRALRRERGWSAREVSERLTAAGWPITRASINQIEANARDGKLVRRVTVDDLMALAEVLGVDPASMLTAPACDACNGVPPGGFTCNQCGSGS